MMKNPHPSRSRLYVLAAALGLMLLLFLAALYDAQILHGSENRAKSIASNATWQSVEASRGIITDRNGKVLVSNRLAYTLTFSKKSFQTDAELNDAIWRLIGLCQETDTVWVDTLPISQSAPYLYLASRTRRPSPSFWTATSWSASPRPPNCWPICGRCFISTANTPTPRPA